MRLPRLRFTARRLMTMVAVSAVMLSLGSWAQKVIDDYLKSKGAIYYGVYRAPDGRITRGNIIVVTSESISVE
jgi:hypothetical protein